MAGALDLARADGEDRRIELVDYDPSWPARFSAEAARLAKIVPDLELHHIGSTAVHGLAAKPIIDIMAVVEDLDAAIPVLVAGAGYQFPAAYNATLTGRRWLCRPSASHRTHHLHLVDDPRELARHLRFRDALRNDPQLAFDYATLKRELAER
ncbi:MAG: GrpB family protein, partial [Solirubrobacteraceae bacterium]